MTTVETVVNELEQDKINLSRIFCEKIYGMAYPYGTFTDEIKKIVERCKLMSNKDDIYYATNAQALLGM